MGYELHITRKPDWSGDGPEITLDEWVAVVRSDPEMRLDAFAAAETRDTHELVRIEDPSLAVWTAYSGHGRDGNMAWFYLSHGNVVAKNPDEEIRRKMALLANRLGARVQGDDGEFYDERGQQSGQSAATSRKAPLPSGLPFCRGRELLVHGAMASISVALLAGRIWIGAAAVFALWVTWMLAVARMRSRVRNETPRANDR